VLNSSYNIHLDQRDEYLAKIRSEMGGKIPHVEDSEIFSNTTEDYSRYENKYGRTVSRVNPYLLKLSANK
jgi:hypothetical protein